MMDGELSMFPRLAGQQSTAESLFSHIGGGPMGPTPQELEEGRLKAQFSKLTQFKEYGVKTFDLSNGQSVKAYQKLMHTLFEGVQAKSHVLVMNDRRFVEQPKLARNRKFYLK